MLKQWLFQFCHECKENIQYGCQPDPRRARCDVANGLHPHNNKRFF